VSSPGVMGPGVVAGMAAAAAPLAGLGATMLSGTPEVRGMTAAERREIRQLALEVAMAAREQERDLQEMKREEELVRKRREKIAENAAAALKWRKEWGPAQHGDA
jgi:hypothetical protein